ncbi:MAG: nreC 4 [Bacteroidetes bacterium]|nr:nreC 4 [Bacteroidota bacterium]
MKNGLLHCLYYPTGADDRLLDGTNIRLLQLLSDVKNILITIYDRCRDEYPFRSKQFGTLLDTSVPHGVKAGSTQHFYRLIHPDDVAFVKQTEWKACQFLQDRPSAERSDYMLVCEFRMKNRKGSYSRFLHHVKVMQSDSNGEIRGLFICSELIEEEVFTDICHCYIVNRRTNKFYEINKAGNTSSLKHLSSRERHIMRLLASGKDSLSISAALCISNNTVNNHRRNILDKTGTVNCVQAAVYCKSVGDI